MKNEYFWKKMGRRGVRELFVVSDDRKTLMHIKKIDDPIYNKHGEKIGFINRGWDASYGMYDTETNDIKNGTARLYIKEGQHYTYIIGRLLYTRYFNKGIMEYNCDITPVSEYEKSVKIWSRIFKKIDVRLATTAIYLANPSNHNDMGFPRIKELIESDKANNPTYYIQYSIPDFAKEKGIKDYSVPFTLACFYDVKDGRKLVIDRLPEYRSNELFERFFPSVISEEFAIYPDARIFFEPSNDFETRICRKYMFTPVGSKNEYSVTKDEMFKI